MALWFQAWRALIRRRTFSFLALATLAIGIAATTGAFSIVNGVLLRPLPFPGGDRLVSLYEASPGRRERVSLVAPARLEDWQRLTSTFAAVSGSYAENVTDTSGAEPERLAGRRVAPRFFEVFGMAPLAGRVFAPAEERFGGSKVAVISEDYWIRRFGRSVSAVGARLTIGGGGYSIVGVMPRAVSPPAAGVWLPAQFAAGMLQVREARFLTGVGRMKPGITILQARDDVARVQAALGQQFPRTDKDWSVEVRDLKDVRTGEYRRPLLMVFAAVALLFVIAIANVAGLVLVQLHRRAPEFAIRAAIGASPRQVAAGLFREIALLGAAGVMVGAALAYWLTSLAASSLSSVPRIAEVGVDLRALGFAIAATVVAAVLFGIVPALLTSRSRAHTMGSGGRAIAGGRHRLQSAIVVAQLALGVVLAGSAGLLTRSYVAMTRVDGGFSARGVLTFHAGAAWDEDRTRVGQFQVRLLEALRAMPGVRGAGFANFLPASGATLRSQVRVDGLASDDPGGMLTVGSRTVTSGYLRTLSVPLLAGRWCAETRADLDPSRIRDILVNRAFVERYANGQNVIGRHLAFIEYGAAGFTIAGVVADVHEDGPTVPPPPYVYACLAAGAWPDPEYVVRADGDPRALMTAIRAAVKSLDATRPLFGMKPLDTVLNAALDQPRLNATALTMFAGVAVALAPLGLYRPFVLVGSPRRAGAAPPPPPGAGPPALGRDVVAGAGRLIAAGLLFGVLLVAVAGQLLRAMLFGIEPYDPIAVAPGVPALALVGLAAVAVPARQASRANAMEAMQNG